ncbi:hypothetical protein LF1_52060 [Rubripirellula obstinata]|uniref:Uncharacterized protein n=1 Tax=Rubripirellula obstinata TaxID=406547 RepID=A0A5B1C8D3_9BACT|nr:hypothetical protein LF1_52060 [Rubripirellula obstinata]
MAGRRLLAVRHVLAPALRNVATSKTLQIARSLATVSPLARFAPLRPHGNERNVAIDIFTHFYVV